MTVVPLRHISTVNARKINFMRSSVDVTTSGGTLEFIVKNTERDEVRGRIVAALMAQGH